MARAAALPSTFIRGSFSRPHYLPRSPTLVFTRFGLLDPEELPSGASEKRVCDGCFGLAAPMPLLGPKRHCKYLETARNLTIEQVLTVRSDVCQATDERYTC